MDAYDYLKFVAWLKDSKRQPAIFAFTAGEVRDAAYAVEQSGILAQLAAEASAVETLWKVEAIVRRGDEEETHEVVIGRRLYGGQVSASYVVDGDCQEVVFGLTILAALAALVQAEGKEAGK